MTEPLACRLTPSEVGGMEQRLAGYRELGRHGLLAVDREPRRAVLRFRRTPEIRRGVDTLVAAESRCCAFLGYAVEEQADAIVLALTAPPGGEPMLSALTEILAGTQAARAISSGEGSTYSSKRTHTPSRTVQA